MLKLPQITLTTAAVFFNRALMRMSLVKTPAMTAANLTPLHHYQIAATSLFIATKAEENIRRTKDLICACIRVALKNPKLAIDETNSKDFWRWRDTLLTSEDILLEALCFDMTVESPHKALFDTLKMLGVEGNKRLRNASWAFVNDSCLTTLCLRQRAPVIAAAAVWCGARHCDLDPTFPPGAGAGAGAGVGGGVGGGIGDDAANGEVNGAGKGEGEGEGKGELEGLAHTPWWVTLGVRLGDIKRAVNYMADLYGGVPRAGEEESIYARKQETIEEGDDDEMKFGGLADGEGGGEAEEIKSPAENADANVNVNANGASRSPSEPRGVKRTRGGEVKESSPAGSEEGEVEE